MKFSWHTLPKPFTSLAPLDGVTDVVFRQVIAEIGKPDVMFTEFTMTDGIVSKAKARLLERFELTKEQRPVIAQIWGTIPEHFYQSAKEIAALGLDGIDINMGCPVRDVVSGGACSALIKNPTLAAELIQATKEGAGELPVSVKTRIGFNHDQKEEWLGHLLKQDIAALTVHLRTTKEMSKVPAHWELMDAIKKLRDDIAPHTILIGNGDIISLEEINEKYDQFGIDGFMVGRGIFMNPWMFNPKVVHDEITVQQRLDLFAHHIDLYYKRWGDSKNFANLKKFAKTYISNFPGSSELRVALMETKSMDELKTVLKEYKPVEPS